MDKQQNELIKSYFRTRKQTIEAEDVFSFSNYTGYEASPYIFKLGLINPKLTKGNLIPIPTKPNYNIYQHSEHSSTSSIYFMDEEYNNIINELNFLDVYNAMMKYYASRYREGYEKERLNISKKVLNKFIQERYGFYNYEIVGVNENYKYFVVEIKNSYEITYRAFDFNGEPANLSEIHTSIEGLSHEETGALFADLLKTDIDYMSKLDENHYSVITKNFKGYILNQNLKPDNTISPNSIHTMGDQNALINFISGKKMDLMTNEYAVKEKTTDKRYDRADTYIIYKIIGDQYKEKPYFFIKYDGAKWYYGDFKGNTNG